jgi:RES domain-containing protein
VPVAHRIVKTRHARTAFSGEGARIAGGRWNRPGDAVVYVSASLALAAIETFVHLGADAVDLRFVHFRIDIPDDVAIERCRRPPARWRAEPPEDSSMRYGSAWLRRGSTAALEVPSVLVPSEKNYLLNPNHRDFARLHVNRPAPFVFDPRMWK